MRNRKGFTLIELLAVVTILGIIMMVSIPAVSRYIHKSKQESKESQRQTLVMAAKSYARDYTSVLPKAIGETKNITAKELRNAKYLKEDLVDADKKDCMKDSLVRIYKYDTKGYTYTPYIYCEGDEIPSTIEGIKPNIKITFTDTKNNIDASQNVSISSLVVNIDGNKDSDGNPFGLDGYSYTISVTYSDTGELVEIFNSGSLNAGGRESLKIEKDLTEFVDITRVNNFLVTVEAYNRDGGYRKETADSSYKDTTKPICGTITGQAGEDEWDKSWRSKKISITCSDGDGSGCVKDKYTKTFDTEMEIGYITIADNAGNTTDCPVRVHLDWTRPELNVSIYKLTSSDGKGVYVAGAVSDEEHSVVTINEYKDSYGSNQWLNKANYPYGIYVEISTSDNVVLNVGNWYYNSTGIGDFAASNLNTMTQGTSKTFTSSDNKTYKTIKGEGIRRAKYELTDKAGNKSTVIIEANMDRTNPVCKNSGGSTAWKNTDVSITGKCTDSISKCTKDSITKKYTSDIDSAIESPGTIYDNANNRTVCAKDRNVHIDKTAPTCNATKTVIETPDGVTVKLSCYDASSGISSCPCRVEEKGGDCIANVGLTQSKYYYVSDVAGNSNSCYVDVTEYTAYRKKTRSCNTYNRCAAAGCESFGGWSGWHCTNTYTAYPYGECYDGGTDCAGSDLGALKYNCNTRSCSYYNRSADCGCESYSAWSGWTGYSYLSCSDDSYTKCGSRTQYK